MAETENALNLGRWLCKYFRWHTPTKQRFDGFQFTAKCLHCNKKIIQDSQGNWF